MATREEIRVQLAERIAAGIREVTINAHAEISRRTPVDTGYARANWQITIGVPATGEVPAGGAPLALALESYNPERDGAAFITNNAKYIRRLNAGHSQQAPAGFVEAAIASVIP